MKWDLLHDFQSLFKSVTTLLNTSIYSAYIAHIYVNLKIFQSKTDTIRTAFSQFWNETRSFKWLSVIFQSLVSQYDSSEHKLLFSRAQNSLQPLNGSKFWKEGHQKEKKLVKSPLAQYIGFMFCFTKLRLRLAPMKWSERNVLLSTFQLGY